MAAKRVNLADLAKDDFYNPVQGNAPVVTSAPTPVTVAAVGSASRPAPAPAAPEPEFGARMVSISRVAPNPLNKRPPGFDVEIEDLAATIRARGIIQPLVVCGVEAYLGEFPEQSARLQGFDWVVLIGNRRLEGGRLAPLAEVPIIVNDEHVTSMYEVMLIENGHRRALPPLLEAEALSAVMKKRNLSLRELGSEIGKTHTFIRQRLALLELLPELKRAFADGELTVEKAREFGDLPKATQQQIVEAGPPYRLPSAQKAAAAAVRRRAIRVSSPAVAAESIRSVFSPDELRELIKLLAQEAPEPAAEA